MKCMESQTILGMQWLKNATSKEENETWVAGTEQHFLNKISTNSPQHNSHLLVHKYQHDTLCAAQIFLQNPCLLSVSCIQLLLFTVGHSNFL